MSLVKPTENIYGESVDYGASSGTSAYEEQTNQGGFVNWISGTDPVGHNESLYAYQREQAAAKAAFEREANFNAAEAQKNREWQEMMSNTAFQRQVADLEKAGFSPLAALGGGSGAPVSSGSAASASGHPASSSAARGPSSNMGGVIGALVTAVALMVTKGMSAVSKAAASSGAAVQASQKSAEAITKASEMILKNAKVPTDAGFDKWISQFSAKERKTLVGAERLRWK